MKKKFFEDPEMELVRFDPRDAFIATSGSDGFVDSEEEEQEEPDPE